MKRRKVIEYIIISYDVWNPHTQITEYLKDGWELYGKMKVSQKLCFQALVKYEAVNSETSNVSRGRGGIMMD